MSLFNCLEYRDWIEEWLKKKPKSGHGELSKIARALEVNSTLISQVLSKSRDFSLEQGYALCSYFSFNQLETQYFMLLLQAERAGTQGLRKYFEAELKSIQKKAGLVENRVEVDTDISDSDKSFLVGNWKPTAILVFTGLEAGVTLEEIAENFNIPIETVREICEELVEMGLVSQSEGKFKTGFRRLHLAKGSSFLLRHYTNWRLKAIEQSDQQGENDVMYTSVSSIAEKDIPQFKEKLLAWISEYAKSVSASPAEEAVCFNLDFFKIR
jgi:hypothetical protein